MKTIGPKLQFPDLTTLSTPRALIYTFLTGFGAAFLGLLMPTLLGGRGSELGIVALMLSALPAIFILPSKTGAGNSAAWFRQWAIYVVYFLGLSACFTAWCMFWPPENVWNSFGFVADLPEVKMITLAQGQFPSALELIPHNLGVALAIVILTFIYGVAGGSVLLTWNVCVWSVALTMLVRRSAEVYSYGAGILAVLPHSLIELFAYTMVIVVTVRFRGSENPSPEERNRMAVMLVLTLVFIGLAAGIEANWPHWVLEQFKK